MKKTTRSLLEELNDIATQKHKEGVIESRATHIIDSAINLIRLIRESYPPEAAYELERRLLNSIRGEDPSKFVRGIRKLKDNKETASQLKVIQGNLPPEDK